MRLQAKVGGSEKEIGLMDGHVEYQEGRRANIRYWGWGKVRANPALSRRASDGPEEFEGTRFQGRRWKIILILLILSADPL